MITISFDEQGGFETLANNEALFVAGLLYDDGADPEMGISGDTSLEKARIRSYYERACEKASIGASSAIHYPINLHCNSNEPNWKVARAKDAVNQTLGEFLKEGTFEGQKLLQQNGSPYPDRTGHYYLYANIKSSKGMEELLGNNVSALVRDDIASNLYVHMAENLLGRLIFHNPIIKNVKLVDLDFPTRMAVFNDLSMEDGFVQLGRRKENFSTPTKKYYALTNADVFRTALEREMIQTGRTDIQLEKFKTRSIKYDAPQHKWESFSFLYLADSICAYIGHQMTGHNPVEWIEEIQTRCAQLVKPACVLTFAYDTMDSYYDQTLRAYEQGRYFDSFDFLYTASKSDSEMKAFYLSRWFELLTKELLEAEDIEAFDESIYRFDKYLHRNNLDPDRALFIYQMLEKMEIISNPEIRKETLYNLYDCGISAYTHKGLSEDALKCYEKAQQYVNYMGIERVVSTRNKLVVLLNDLFNYDKSLEIAQDNISYLEELAELREIMIDRDQTYSMFLAKGYSQMGQCLSLTHNSDALAAYDKALEYFGKGNYNYYITLSYKMHHLLDNVSSEYCDAYIKNAVELFGGYENLKEQFEYILEEGKKGNTALLDMRHALNLYVKGIYTYCLDQVDAQLLKRLLKIAEEVDAVIPGYKKRMAGHPWELTFKYIALIALKKGKSDKASIYRDYMSKSISAEKGILKTIVETGNADIYHEMGNQNKFKEALFAAIAASNLPIEISDPERAYKKLGRYVLFFYR